MRISIIIYYDLIKQNLIRCLDSINGNNFKDYEIIITNVNDDVINIINNYTFLPIKLINENVSSIGNAKNIALDKAIGEYIMFMSSSDYLEMDFLDKMYSKAKTEDADIVACDYKLTGKKINKEVRLIKYDVPSDTITSPSLYVGFNIEMSNKIFKRILFLNNNMYFLENTEFDDYYLTLLLMKNSKIISKVNSILYNKYQSKEKLNKIEDIFNICDIVLKEYENSNNITKVAIFDITVVKLFKVLDIIALEKDNVVRNVFINKVYDYLDEKIISWEKMEYFKGIIGNIKKNRKLYMIYLNIKNIMYRLKII
jgi:hypothetical protein